MIQKNRETRLYQILQKDFAPDHLEIINESHHHAGHAGSPGTGESHYQIRIHAKAFDGLSLKNAHQRIYQAIAEEFKTGLHALSIKLITNPPTDSVAGSTTSFASDSVAGTRDSVSC